MCCIRMELCIRVELFDYDLPNAMEFPLNIIFRSVDFCTTFSLPCAFKWVFFQAYVGGKSNVYVTSK